MAKTEFKNGPDLAGWAIAAGVGVVAFAVCIVLGAFTLVPAAAIAGVIFLVVGLILGLPRAALPGPGEVSLTTPDLTQGHAAVAPYTAPHADATETVAQERVDHAPMAAAAETPVVATPVPAAVVAAAAPASAFVAMVPEADPLAGSEPVRLQGPRNGVADDLKEIEGIGPALEVLCNDLGFYHFDQIAQWSDTDVAWVDHNMPRFRGRIQRDKWVAQARLIVSEGLDAFRIRAKTNDY